MKKLVVAGNIGFCFGVKRTVQTAERLLEKHKRLYSIGDIVHNPIVMEDLKSKGLCVVSSEEEVEKGPFIVRSHGIGPATIDRLKKKGVEIYDATCPSVKKIHSLIKKLDRERYFIIIIGNENHPEVVALREYGSNTCVSRDGKGLPGGRKTKKAAVIGQTTLSFTEYFKSAIRFITSPVFADKTIIYNTICRITGERQEESAGISRNTEAVFVLGGKTSSNTAKLCHNCRRFNRCVYHIENTGELEKVSLKGIRSAGLISGTSTPEDFILAVKNYMKKKGYGEVQYNEQD